MADLFVVPSDGDTLGIGRTEKPVSHIVSNGSFLDPDGAGATPAEVESAYEHSQIIGNPHQTPGLTRWKGMLGC